MRYLIAGASTYGVDNMGDDAMLSCLIRGLREFDHSARIVLLARHPNVDFDRAFGITSIQNLDHQSNDLARGRFFLGLNAGDSRENLNGIREALIDTDLLIIGGNSLMEISENTFLRGVSSYATTLATFSVFLGKPYGLFGLNVVGPIRSPFVASQAKFLVENSVATTVREQGVLHYLSDVGVDLGRVHVTGDPAYGVDLRRVEDYDGEDLLLREGIRLDSTFRTITICLREEYWRTNSEAIENLGSEVCSLLTSVLRNTCTQILFIPNCHYQHGHPLEDDRRVNLGIRSRFGEHPRVHYVTSALNLYQTLSLFKLTDLHISNRRHSNIFAALYGKPFIPINTSHESHISAFVADLNQSELLVSTPQFSTKVAEKIDYVFGNYAEVSSRLLSVVSSRTASGLSSVIPIFNYLRV